MKSAKKAVKKAAAKRKAAAAKKRARKAAVAPFSSTGGGRVVRMRKLGPIAEAEFRLRPLTVFVGPNGTGKTFACKALYSFFRAMEDNHVEAAFRHPLSIIDSWLARARNYNPRPGDDIRKIGLAISGAEEKVRVLRDKLAQLSGGSFRAQMENAERARPSLEKMCGETLAAFKKASPAVKEASTPCRKMVYMPPHPHAGAEFPQDVPATHLHWTMKDLAEFAEMLPDVSRKSGRELIADGMRANLERRLAGNFQSSFLPDKFQTLGIRTTDLGAMEVGGCGLFERNGKGDYRFELPHDNGLWQPGFSRTVFIPSPDYWKLRNPLEDKLLRLPSSPAGVRPLDDIPQYFGDLMSLLRHKFPPPNIRSVCASLEEFIGGKVVMSESGELLFREKTGPRGEVRLRTMHNTAAGKVNLGMLSFLIERGIIDDNALVFFDEPENNLHPMAQVRKMAETLALLVNSGVHVVIATHSDWILDVFAHLVRQGKVGGDSLSLQGEEVGVYRLAPGVNGTGFKAVAQKFSNNNGYLPQDVRRESTDLYNRTVPLQVKLDMLVEG